MGAEQEMGEGFPLQWCEHEGVDKAAAGGRQKASAASKSSPISKSLKPLGKGQQILASEGVIKAKLTCFWVRNNNLFALL